MIIVILIVTPLAKNDKWLLRLLILKKINTFNKKVRISKPKPSTGKTLPGDKNTGLDPEIRFYKIEDDDDTEEGEEYEILIKSDLIHKEIK